MTEYNEVFAFGGSYFSLSDVSVTEQPSTLKTNIGKTLVEKQIPLRNTKDKIITINGVVTGLSRTSGQTLAAAIENDRASLINLSDGYFHVYTDGKHSFNGVIEPGSLRWPDEAIRSPGQPYKFTVIIKEWQ